MEEERTGLQDDLLSIATPGGLGAIGVENYHHPQRYEMCNVFPVNWLGLLMSWTSASREIAWE